MEEKRYNICLSVPIGKRKGTMLIRETNSCLEGWMEIMEHRNPFSGQFSDNGCMSISGVIQTLVSCIRYTGTGTINGKMILLNLATQSGDNYSVFGEEYTGNDKIL